MTTLVNRILRTLLPVRCVLCGAFTPGAALCEACNGDLPWLDPAGVELTGAPPVFAALAYEYPVDRLIVAAKFHRRLSHARMLGELLAEYLPLTDPGHRFGQCAPRKSQRRRAHR